MSDDMVPTVLQSPIEASESILTECPLCGSPDLRAQYRFAQFSVLKCRECEGSWRTNMYSTGDITAMYTGEEYSRNPYFSYDVGEFKKTARGRYCNYVQALSAIESMVGVGKLLDLGCGSGAFLSVAQERGWSVSGVELSPELSRLSRRAVGVEVINASFEAVELPAESYDVITMWDIIEHVLDPVGCLEKVSHLLKPGGVALFCTPDEDSVLARAGLFLYRISGGKVFYPALALHPTYHTYFFSKSGFKEMVRKSGMQAVRCYSQEAFFEHSQLPSPVLKWGIWAIEKLSALADCRYEIVCLAQKPR
jgi:2-polyprenyl-3-methyl-5-hydroxy-6-metoxy-1,4-benzoquinol methylase